MGITSGDQRSTNPHRLEGSGDTLNARVFIVVWLPGHDSEQGSRHDVFRGRAMNRIPNRGRVTQSD
jgi:hypothetical protein